MDIVKELVACLIYAAVFIVGYAAWCYFNGQRFSLQKLAMHGAIFGVVCRIVTHIINSL